MNLFLNKHLYNIRAPLLLPSMLLLVTADRPAWAHKVYLYAEAVGQKLQGRAYFRGGEPAQQALLRVFFPDGRLLLQTKTDENGQFSFRAPARCDYRLVVDTGDGHGAETMVPAADLPESLPLLENTSLAPPETPLSAGENPSSEDAQNVCQPGASSPASGRTSPPSAPSDRLVQEIEEAVHRQIAPLARKIEQLEHRTRWTDVLAGIGYIVGLTGMGFYLLGIQKNRQKFTSLPAAHGSDRQRSSE